MKLIKHDFQKAPLQFAQKSYFIIDKTRLWEVARFGTARSSYFSKLIKRDFERKVQESEGLEEANKTKIINGWTAKVRSKCHMLDTNNNLFLMFISNMTIH